MDKELGQVLREDAEALYEERKNGGKCPQWYRRRDARNEVVNKFTGRKESDRTYRRTKFVVDNGVPELVKALNAGTIKVAAAFQIATLTHSEQNEVMADAFLRRVFLRSVRDEVPEDRPAKVAVTVDRAIVDALVTAGLLDADDSGSKSAVGEAVANALKIMFSCQ
jgi:hypothetical protein